MATSVVVVAVVTALADAEAVCPGDVASLSFGGVSVLPRLCVAGWCSVVGLWWCGMLWLYQCVVVYGQRFIVVIV